MTQSLPLDPSKITVQDELAFEGVKQAGPDAVNRFIEMVRNGESVRMAAMLATRSPPTLGVSDHTFMKNRASLLEQCGGSERVLKAWQDGYKARTGENLPGDAVLMRGVADGMGDPDAVITHKHGLKEVMDKALAKGKRLETEDFGTKQIQSAPVVQEVQLGEDIIAGYMQEYIAEDPSLAEKDPREIREMVIANHSSMSTEANLAPMGATTLKDLCTTVFDVAPERRETQRKTQKDKVGEVIVTNPGTPKQAAHPRKK